MRQPTKRQPRTEPSISQILAPSLFNGTLNGFSLGIGSALGHKFIQQSFSTDVPSEKKNELDCDSLYLNYEMICTNTSRGVEDDPIRLKCTSLLEKLIETCQSSS